MVLVSPMLPASGVDRRDIRSRRLAVSPVTAADFLMRRLSQIPLTDEVRLEVLREMAGYFFRPSRLGVAPLDSKRPHVLKKRIACDETPKACVHCVLAWDLLRLAKRGASPWSGYWSEENKERAKKSNEARKLADEEKRTI